MEKSIFIKKLLENEKFSKDQKEQFLKLVANEYSNNQIEHDELLKQLNNIKNQYSKIPSDIISDLINNVISQKQNSSKEKSNLPDYINPINLSSFLYEYNQNPILKTTCHLIDSGELMNILRHTKKQVYNFKNHKSAIEQEYFSLLKKYRGRTFKSTNTLIGEYLNNFKNKGWTIDNIMMNWSSSILKEWTINNPGSPPNPSDGLGQPFKFKPIVLKSGHTLNNFNDLVLHFKKQIQFRQAHSLLDMVMEVNFKYRKEAKFNVAGIRENIQLFTDTGKVKQIYNALVKKSIAHFKEVHKEELPVFNLSFTEVKNKIIFSIHNTNSQFGKSVLDVESRYGQDFTNLINNQINGVCDFSLTADFAGEYADISLWPQKKAEPIEEFKGVQFNLIFYRA